MDFYINFFKEILKQDVWFYIYICIIFLLWGIFFGKEREFRSLLRKFKRVYYTIKYSDIDFDIEKYAEKKAKTRKRDLYNKFETKMQNKL